MSEVPYRFCIFYSADFDFFRCAPFVGSEFLMAVAVNRDDVILSVRERLPAERSVAVAPAQLAEICDDLAAKLPDPARVVALFDCRNHFEPWEWGGRNALRYSADPPSFVTRAQKAARDFLLLKIKERALVYPGIEFQSESLDDHRVSLNSKVYRELYDLTAPEVHREIAQLDRRKKILVHVCCGPDAAGVLTQLQSEYEVICFWYDPNIQPRAEYERRLAAFEKVAALHNARAIIGEYDVPRFLGKIAGLEHTPEQGAKCSICYDLRLERAAREAKSLGCDLFTTTLAISPHKVQRKLKVFGERLGEQYGVAYLARNFMKDDGFKQSVEFTEQHEIYRQDYCGCWFSLHEGGPAARAQAESLGLTATALAKGAFALPE